MAATQSGSAARNVEDLMNNVQTGWEALQGATASRKRKLKASLELQKFLSSVRTNLIIKSHNFVVYKHSNVYTHGLGVCIFYLCSCRSGISFCG